tara:strand:- start:556 stop:750 length:195 start_codon:yes stop_codon:yes gene_type:complete
MNLSIKNFGKFLIEYEKLKIIHPEAFSHESSLIAAIPKIKNINALANPYNDGVYKKNITYCSTN